LGVLGKKIAFVKGPEKNGQVGPPELNIREPPGAAGKKNREGPNTAFRRGRGGGDLNEVVVRR